MKILVPLDGSEPAESALEYATENYPDEEIHALHIINPVSHLYGEDAYYNYDQIIETGEEEAEELFEEARAVARENGATLSTETKIGQPAREIVEYIETEDIDHVVIGSHGRSGVSRVLLGSVAEAVVRRSPVPVTVIR